LGALRFWQASELGLMAPLPGFLAPFELALVQSVELSL
jgi:hypothetical protein